MGIIQNPILTLWFNNSINECYCANNCRRPCVPYNLLSLLQSLNRSFCGKASGIFDYVHFLEFKVRVHLRYNTNNIELKLPKFDVCT